MNLPKKVDIVEVGPRDGLQNEKNFIETEKKMELINALNQTGIERMEATSFVSPKHVPQMADAKEVLQQMEKKEGIQYMVLIPNRKGFELATAAGATAHALVVAASETFNQRNVRMSIDDSMKQLSEVVADAKEMGHFIRFHISTAFWCPFEGMVDAQRTLEIVKQMEQIQVDEIVLCDTIGRANPAQVYSTFSQVLDLSPKAKITAHFHDTYGFAQANAIAALQAGVTSFDTSIGGLGGCPFAPGAAGNASTEDFVFLMHEMGIETGVDFEQLRKCVDIAKGLTERTLTGHIHQLKVN